MDEHRNPLSDWELVAIGSAVGVCVVLLCFIGLLILSCAGVL